MLAHSLSFFHQLSPLAHFEGIRWGTGHWVICVWQVVQEIPLCSQLFLEFKTIWKKAEWLFGLEFKFFLPESNLNILCRKSRELLKSIILPSRCSYIWHLRMSTTQFRHLKNTWTNTASSKIGIGELMRPWWMWWMKPLEI